MTARFFVGREQQQEATAGWEALRDRQAIELAEVARQNPKPTKPGQLSAVFQMGKLTVEQRQQHIAEATEDAYDDLSDLDDTAFAATTAHGFSSKEEHQSPTMAEGGTTFDFSSSPEGYESGIPDSTARLPRFSGE